MGFQRIANQFLSFKQKIIQLLQNPPGIGVLSDFPGLFASSCALLRGPGLYFLRCQDLTTQDGSKDIVGEMQSYLLSCTVGLGEKEKHAKEKDEAGEVAKDQLMPC